MFRLTDHMSLQVIKFNSNKTRVNIHVVLIKKPVEFHDFLSNGDCCKKPPLLEGPLLIIEWTSVDFCYRSATWN